MSVGETTRTTSGRIVLVVCCGSMFLVGLDTTTLNIGLPVLQHDLHASITSVQWAVAGYTLVVACLLMSSGATSDRLGRRGTFQIGLLLFLIGSLSCSLAETVGWLIASRILQAIGGSMMNPVAMSILATAFPEAQERGRAIGWWVGTAGVSMGAGPILGGLLVDTAGWRSIFLINIPVCAAAIILTRRFIPVGKAATPRPPDLLGQYLMAFGLGLLVYGLIEAPRNGWISPEIFSCLLGAAVILAVFIVHEVRCNDPLLQPRLFRAAPLSGAAVVILLAYTVLGGFLFLSPLYLEDVRGDSAVGAGLALLPMAVLMGLSGPVSGLLAGRNGPRQMMLLGCVALTLGGLVCGLPTGAPSELRLAVAYVLVGLGLGSINPAAQNTLIAGMPAHLSVAAALGSTTRQLSQSLGVAIIGSLIASDIRAADPRAAILHAVRPAWLIFAGCGAAALCVAAVSTGARALDNNVNDADVVGAES